jgi:hypothetical protein
MPEESMPQYDNTNRGVAFINDTKESDSHPDMKGSINIEGTEYWLSAWWKTPQKGGEDFLSFSVKLKEGQGQGQGQRSAPKRAAAPQPRGRGRPQSVQTDADEDIPF